MLRKDYFKCCSCAIIGYIIGYIIAPIICVWTTYTYLNISMVKDSDYYAHVCVWVTVIATLLFSKHILFTYANKVFYSNYGVKSIPLGVNALDARADKLKLTGKEKELFKRRKHKAAKLRKFYLNKFLNEFLDNLFDCLAYSGLIFLGVVVLFVFLYFLTSLPMMLSIALELLKLGVAVLLIVTCWS